MASWRRLLGLAQAEPDRGGNQKAQGTGRGEWKALLLNTVAPGNRGARAHRCRLWHDRVRYQPHNSDSRNAHIRAMLNSKNETGRSLTTLCQCRHRPHSNNLPADCANYVTSRSLKMAKKKMASEKRSARAKDVANQGISTSADDLLLAALERGGDIAKTGRL